MRAAIYYAPALHDPLWAAGARWLGRDPETGAAAPQPPVPDLPAMTQAPRLYGFHATLKPPMRLRTDYAALMADVEQLAATAPPFALPALAVRNHHGFLALREDAPCPALHALADRCVEELDAHRAPPDEAELARRRGKGLPPEQDAMLERWGYPHVLATWFFHMTLTRRLSDAERDAVLPAAEAHFAPALARERLVDALCVFTQARPGAAFLLAERVALGG